jgi:hypothetical protein
MVPSGHRRAGSSRLIGCVRTASTHMRRCSALLDEGQCSRTRYNLNQRSCAIGLERITGICATVHIVEYQRDSI